MARSIWKMIFLTSSNIVLALAEKLQTNKFVSLLKWRLLFNIYARENMLIEKQLCGNCTREEGKPNIAKVF